MIVVRTAESWPEFRIVGEFSRSIFWVRKKVPGVRSYQVVIVNIIMVHYCKADAAYVRISSDKLWKVEEEVIIVEYKDELYEYFLKSSMKRKILAGKR